MLSSRACLLLLGLSSLVVLRCPLRGQTFDTVNVAVKGSVAALAVQPDGKILVGGAFTNVAGMRRMNLARLNPDGTLDLGFDVGTTGWPSNVASILVQPDRKILVGGRFYSVGGHSCNGLARLHEDGRVDTSFLTSEGGSLLSLALQPDGKVLVGTGMSLLRVNADGSLDPAINFRTDAGVYTIALQPDGKIIVGGDFQTIGGQSFSRLARINADGTLDASFRPAANARVDCILVQVDGRVLVGGTFATLCGQPRRYIGRLLADGTLDDSFSVYLTSSSYEVRSISLQTDGKVILSGGFSAVDGIYGAQVARVMSNGQLDPSFKTVAYLAASLAVQNNGKVVVASETTIRRLNPVDIPTEQVSADSSTVVWRRGGSAPEVDDVTVYSCSEGTNWLMLGHAERGTDNWALTGLALAPNLTICVRGRAASGAYDASGSIMEASFGPPAFTQAPASRTAAAGQTAVFSAAAVGSPEILYHWFKDGLALVGATNAWLALTNVQSAAAGLYRVLVSNSWGSMNSDPACLAVVPQVTVDSFKPTADSYINSSAVQCDGKVLIGGSFNHISGEGRICLARLHPDGELDRSFDARLGGASVVASIVIQPDARIVIGGSFADVGGSPRPGIARLLPDGRVDPAFLPAPHNYLVRCLALQPDGRLLVAGSRGAGAGGLLVRLNADGSEDPGFVFTSNAEVTCAAVQADDRILVSGYFTNVHGISCRCIARLHGDGSLDQSFVSPFVASAVSLLAADLVSAVLPLPDGSLLATPFLGYYSRPILKLGGDGALDPSYRPDGVATPGAMQADGKVLFCGSTDSTGRRSYVGRLYADGSPDATFVNPVGTNAAGYLAGASVSGLNLQPDGSVLVSGQFTTLGGLSRTNLARLTNTAAAEQLLVVENDTIQWFRGGASPEVWRTTFEYSTNGADWILLGAGRRIAGGWALTNVSVPEGAGIRARGFILAARNRGSWFIESYNKPVIVTEAGSIGFGSDRFGFNIAGPAGSNVVTEYSANLQDWFPQATNLLGPIRAYVSSPADTNWARMFFRLRLQ